jgi:hypothetical protein
MRATVQTLVAAGCLALGFGSAQAQCECCTRLCEGGAVVCTCSEEGGCAWSCLATEPSRRLSLGDRVLSMELVGASPVGLEEHLRAVASHWTVTVELPTTERVTKSYEDLTFEALMKSLAAVVSACVEIDDRRSTIRFGPIGTCRPPAGR